MNIKIKRRWDAELNEWGYRATCYGPGNESYYCDGHTPGQALQALSSGDMIAGLVYASTLLAAQESQCAMVLRIQNGHLEDSVEALRKKNAKLRKELKGLKK